MPTSSQSKILSVIDYQLVQQPSTVHDEVTKSNIPASSTKTTGNELKRSRHKNDRRPSTEFKNYEDDNSLVASNITTVRRSSTSKNNDSCNSSRAAQRSDILHVPVINLNDMAHNQPRVSSNSLLTNESRQSRTVIINERTKSTFTNGARKASPYHRNSIDSGNEDSRDYGYSSQNTKKYTTPMSGEENTSSASDADQTNDNYNDNDDPNRERRPSLLNENARRLLILGTIRPSKTFYKNLSDADAEHLMEYFRKMKNSHKKMTSEEIHQDLSTKFVEYKPKIFFDSTITTKHQVTSIERIVEEYADTIRTNKAEFVKLDNPMRFVIKPLDNEKPLITIPREYNDCFITLVTRSDPLRKSDLVSGLVRTELSEDIKTNSLDISYFPGGINYDVPRNEIDENGQMNLDTYQKLKKRLSSRKVWHFDGPPEKKPNALLAIVPPDSTVTIDHQRLLDAIYDRLKASPTNENSNTEQQILSIEFVPLSCILNSYDISNQYVVECDTKETKQNLMEKPLKITLNKQSVNLDLLSYDENMQREYEKFIKAEKYRELIKNHDSAVKRVSKTKE